MTPGRGEFNSGKAWRIRFTAWFLSNASSEFLESFSTCSRGIDSQTVGF